METLKKNILDIIITEVNSINEKVKGLNFLEILKINLISKILPIVNNLKFPTKPRWALDESAVFLKGAGVKL